MEAIIQYLKQKVIGKTLYTDELSYQLEDGKLEGIYSDEITFCNIRQGDSGFSMDMFVVSNEKIYELGKNGAHAALRKDFSGIALFRYELALRKSTGELTGTMRYCSGTVASAPAEAIVNGVYGMKLENGVLSWLEQQVLYRDQPAGQGSFRSIAFDAHNKFYFENEKLRYEYDGTCYDIDAESMEKKPSADIFPHFLSKEKQYE